MLLRHPIKTYTTMNKNNKPIEVLVTPEQFAKMGADNIVRFMRKHEHTAIVGDKKGVNRHIVRYRTWHDRMNYKNPCPEY